VIEIPGDAAGVSPALQETLRRETRTGTDLLLLDVPASGLLEEPAEARIGDALGAFRAICAVWPGTVGLRVHPVREPAFALPVLARFVALGCAFIAVAPAGPGLAHQLVVSDLVRHCLGVPTICEGLATVDEAETALVAGRADLVSIG
jgi:hypothetical protein